MHQLKSGVDNVMDNVVNNAQKSFMKFKSIFKPAPQPTPSTQSNMIIKGPETNQILFHSQEDNYDIDEDEQSSPSTKSPSNLSLSSSSQSINEYSEAEENIWEISHRIYPKKSMIDIEHLPYVNFIKRKKVENVLSFIGFSKPSNQLKEIKYIALFDEYFIYMIKMTEKENNQNNFNKKIGNHYDLRMISDMQQKDEENGMKCITLLFILDNDFNDFKSVVKNFHMQTHEACRFMSIFKFYLGRLKIPLIFKDDEKNKGLSLSNKGVKVN